MDAESTPITGDTPGDVLAALYARVRALEEKRKIARKEYARILNDPHPGDGVKLVECLATLAPRPDEIVAVLNAVAAGGGRLRAWSASDLADDIAAVRGQDYLLRDIRNFQATLARVEGESDGGWPEQRRERQARTAEVKRELQNARERLRQYRLKFEYAFHLIPLP